MKDSLEEVAENSFLANKLENSNAVEKAHYIAGFRKGAKWQQQRSYSEEDMKQAFHVGRLYLGREGDTNFEQFIEQFKKK